MRIGVVVSARLGSSRLPGKALKQLVGMPSLRLLFRRLRASDHWSDCVLATTTCPEDEELVRLAEAEGALVFRGHPTDLIARHLDCAARFGFEWAVRVTGDCPFLNAEILDGFLAIAMERLDADLVTTKPRYPVGLDVEAFSVAAMARAAADPRLDEGHREHLTKFFYDRESEFSIVRADPPKALKPFAKETFTLDTPEDYAKFERWLTGVNDPNFSLEGLPIGAGA